MKPILTASGPRAALQWSFALPAFAAVAVLAVIGKIMLEHPPHLDLPPLPGFGLLAIYLLPTFAAMPRNRFLPVVFAINLLLGWTVIGWIAALALAVAGHEKP